MSRVDNSDNQRIREVNEAELRKKVQNEKKSQEGRTERSFREVMQNKAQRTTQKETAKEQAAQKKEGAQESVLDRVRKQAPRSELDKNRRAALARQMKGGLLKKRAAADGESSRADLSRAEELNTKSELELEHVDNEALVEEEHEVIQTEEKQAEIKQELDRGGPTDRADADGRRQQKQSTGGGDQQSETRASQVEGPRRATRSAIPQEVLQRLVGAIYKAVSADGRTSMRITLKGGKLDGVTIDIKSDNGKVKCEFSNCGKELKSMLNRGKRALAGGLSRRGLKLESLTVS